MYCITYVLSNPHETDFLYTNANTAIEALHTLQTQLDTTTLHRIESVSIELYDSVSQTFVDMKLDRTCKAFVDYVKSI